MGTQQYFTKGYNWTGFLCNLLSEKKKFLLILHNTYLNFYDSIAYYFALKAVVFYFLLSFA